MAKEEIEIVELLLANNAEINVRAKDGSTPLHIAVSRQHLGMIQFLVDHGADINIKRTSDNKTPLDFAEGECLIYLRKVMKVRKKICAISLLHPSKDLAKLFNHYSNSAINKLFEFFGYSRDKYHTVVKDIIKTLSQSPNWSLQECITFIDSKSAVFTCLATSSLGILVRDLKRLAQNNDKELTFVTGIL